jgi:GT2 family glycosyltransferase
LRVENTAMPVDMSIIIVNWKSAHYVQKCLESIYKDMSALLFEIIVIDNASYDSCDTMISEQYPTVRFIQSSFNLGFAGANNKAYKQSCGKTLLFLNPDTEIIGQAITMMHRLLWETPEAGAIGCTLLNTDGTLQASCIQAFPTILNQLLDAEALRRHFPVLSLWGMRPLFERSEIPLPVEVVSGACLMVKRNAFESAGLFSTDYFMYAEDTDLCYKIRSSGLVVYYTAEASVVHHGGGSSKLRGRDYFAAVVMQESLFRFMIKCHGKLYGYLYRITMGSAALFRAAILISLIILIPRRSVHEALRISLGKWIKIFRWSIGREKWAHLLNHEMAIHDLRE